MSVYHSASGNIVLQGDCPSEDAEELIRLLLAGPGNSVDWRPCTSAHSAVIQVLLAARVPMLGPATDPALEKWLGPILAGSCL